MDLNKIARPPDKLPPLANFRYSGKTVLPRSLLLLEIARKPKKLRNNSDSERRRHRNKVKDSEVERRNPRALDS